MTVLSRTLDRSISRDQSRGLQPHDGGSSPPAFAWLVNWTFEGANGATSFPADLIGGVGVSGIAGAQLTTSDPLEGTSSLLLDGSTQSAFASDNDLWYLGTNPFAIRIRFNAFVGSVLQVILSQFRALNGSRAWRLAVSAADAIQFLWSVDGIVTAGTVSGGVMLAGENYEVLVTRDNDGFVRVYLDGVMVGKSGAAVTSNIRQVAASLRFGCDSDSANTPTNFLQGMVDLVSLNNIASPNYGDAGYTP
jgi:hypothetical protein